METEEGPGYADMEGGAAGGRSDPWDIPRTKQPGIRAGAAAASAPGAGAYYSGGDILPREELPAYGYRVGDESVDLPHGGLGATGAFGIAAAEAARAGGGAAAVGSWPRHGLGDEFVSGGRHVLYCGADIPMEQLQAGHWHHAQRPRGCSPLQAVAGSPGGHNHAGGLLLHRTSEPSGSRAMARQEAAPWGRSATGSAFGGGGGRGRGDEPPQQQAAQAAGADVVEDDVLEVEADTPGGYHVAATVLHPADSNDPQEFVVAATAVVAPRHESGAGASAF